MTTSAKWRIDKGKVLYKEVFFLLMYRGKDTSFIYFYGGVYFLWVCALLGVWEWLVFGY